MYFLRSARYSSAGPESGSESGVPLSDCSMGGRGSLLKLLLGGFCVLANECGMSLRRSSGSVFIWTEGKGRYTTFLFCDFDAEKSSRTIPLGSCILSKQGSPCWCPRGSQGRTPWDRLLAAAPAAKLQTDSARAVVGADLAYRVGRLSRGVEESRGGEGFAT